MLPVLANVLVSFFSGLKFKILQSNLYVKFCIKLSNLFWIPHSSDNGEYVLLGYNAFSYVEIRRRFGERPLPSE
jgi:hypothetical protein